MQGKLTYTETQQSKNTGKNYVLKKSEKTREDIFM